MNIQQLIDNAKQSLNAPQHHHAFDESFESCIKCTACTAVCPVSRQNPNYPGPKQSGPDGERLRLKSAELYDEALKYCTNCKRCEIACPSDVKIGDIIVRAITGLKATKFVLEKALKISRHRTLPKYSFGTFRSWYMKKMLESQQKFERKVAYYHGCYVNYNNPQLGKEFIQVFNAMDIGVVLLEKEKCCGLPLSVNQFPERAKKIAQFNTDYIGKMVDENGLDVISEASSCALNLRDEYHHILGIDNAKVRPHIHMVTPFLYQLFKEGKTLPLKPLKLRVAYHTACHVDKAGWAPYTLEVLKQIPGLEVVMLPSQCCGIAGTYGFKEENYEVSQSIGKNLFDNINAGGFDYVISECQTCKWQIDMSSNVTCIHPLTLLCMSMNQA